MQIMIDIREDLCRYCVDKYISTLQDALMESKREFKLTPACSYDLHVAILYLDRLYNELGSTSYATEPAVTVSDNLKKIIHDCYTSTQTIIMELPVIGLSPLSDLGVEINRIVGSDEPSTNYELGDIVKDIKKALVHTTIIVDAQLNQSVEYNEEFHERCEDERKAKAKQKKEVPEISSEDKKEKAAIKRAVTENSKNYIKMIGRVTRLFKHKRYQKIIDDYRSLAEDYAMNVLHEVDKVRDKVYVTIIPAVAGDIRSMLAATTVCANTTKIPFDALSNMTRLQAIEKLFVKKDSDVTDGYSPAKLDATAKMMEPIVTALKSIISTGFISDVVREAEQRMTVSDDNPITEAWEDEPWLPNIENTKPRITLEEAEATQVFTEASLSESFIFKKLNDSSTITSRIADIIRTGNVVERSFIEEQYSQISKTHLSPLSGKVLDAFDKDDIMLIYNKAVHLTVAVPFIVMQFKGKFRALIFIADFSSLTKDGTALNIEMKKLYTLMEAGYVALRYYTNAMPYQRSSVIAKLTAAVYAEMGLRILNKEFALSLDKNSYDMVNYAMSRFYLSNIFGMTSAEVIDSYARGTCKSPDHITLDTVQAMYDDAAIDTLEDLLKFFVKCYPKMERLTFRYYFERWISSYMMGATLAIDNFPYLYYVMLSVLIGSFMINNQALNDPIKNMKGMQHFHGEIARVTP